MNSPTGVTPVIKPSDLGSTLLCRLFKLKEVEVLALLYQYDRLDAKCRSVELMYMIVESSSRF
jgi:hypothetical protein